MRGVAVVVMVAALVACHGKNKSRAHPATSRSSSPDAESPPAKALTPFTASGLDELAHRPLAVLWETNPWLDVIGSDVPTVAVYEDGLVVLQKVEGHTVTRIAGTLSKADGAALAARIDAGLAKAPHRSTANGATDQPTVQILARHGETWREASCYGISRAAVSSAASYSAKVAPAGFVDAYRALLAVNPADQKPWAPEQIEVMLWGFDNARGAKPWPSAVPAPPAGVTPLPPGQGIYKHVIAGKYEAAVKAHLADIAGVNATELNGHKWAMSYRVRIPEEDFIKKVRACAWARAAAEDKKAPPPACN